MNDEELLRYSRHILLPQVDVDGQQKILDASVLVIGVGGLGSPVALYLASSGVGRLILVDDDVVDVSNLQRQVIHVNKRIGLSKVESAKLQISEINPDVHVETFDVRLDKNALLENIAKADVVVDCSDNFTTRQLLNRLCFETHTPLVSGAAIRFEGQLSVFDFRDSEAPCYECLYDLQGDEDLSCSQNGVFAPLVGIVGSTQALETLKLIVGLPSDLRGKLALYDAMKSEWRSMHLAKDPKCKVCGDSRPHK